MNAPDTEVTCPSTSRWQGLLSQLLTHLVMFCLPKRRSQRQFLGELVARMHRGAPKSIELGQWMEQTDFRKSLGGEQHQALDAMARFADVVCPSYRFHYPDLSWLSDEQFSSYLERFNESKRFNSHRRWMLAQLIRLTSQVQGHTAECGTYQGASSWLILKANEISGRQHHIFDSFSGLSAPGAEDGQHWAGNDLRFEESRVREALAQFPNAHYHQGWIPSRFQDVIDCTFSFVHIDVDLRDPTLQSLEFFFPRLSPGGIVVFDDYGHKTCPGATKAIDEYFQSLPEAPILMSCGGAFVIKGVAVQDFAC